MVFHVNQEPSPVMKRLLLLTAFPLLAQVAFAQLAPGTTAPLAAHLRDVNAQWAVQATSLADGERLISFTGDAQRIAMHLHLVRQTLSQRTPEGLSADQLEARTMLLEDLDRYADRGLFPRNDVLPYRNPVFIDPRHTACAVGQLMIESGDGALAERINRDMNLGYVHELVEAPALGADIGSWATANGFSTDELAWIQPAYNPAFTWDPLGGGTDARITTLLTLANNDLLVAGDFTDAGGVTCSAVAIWNGTTYIPLGSGVGGQPVCAAQHNGLIYLGGTFANFNHDLAIWNGSSWAYGNVQPGMAPHVSSLHVHNGELYAGSEASGFSGVTYQAFRLNNGSWVPVGQALNGPLLALETHDGELVTGGAFTGIPTFGQPDTSVMHVARFNGTQWVQLEDGLDAPVHDLLETNTGYLYAGGDLYANLIPTFGLARVAGGVLWEHLMPNHPMYIQQGAGVTRISTLALQDTMVWFGGDFGIVQLMSTGFKLGRFLGAPDQVQAAALFYAPVNAVCAWNGGMVSGGDFAAEGMLAVPYIAFTNLSTGITPLNDVTALALWPSPAEDQVNVDAGSRPFQGEAIEVVDAAGHVVNRVGRAQGPRVSLSINGLAPGSYWVRVVQDGRVRTAPFVKR